MLAGVLRSSFEGFSLVNSCFSTDGQATPDKSGKRHLLPGVTSDTPLTAHVVLNYESECSSKPDPYSPRRLRSAAVSGQRQVHPRYTARSMKGTRESNRRSSVRRKPGPRRRGPAAATVTAACGVCSCQPHPAAGLCVAAAAASSTRAPPRRQLRRPSSAARDPRATVPRAAGHHLPVWQHAEEACG